MSDILEKAVASNVLGTHAGGFLPTPQVNRFLDYLVDNTVLVGKEARTERIRGESAELTKISIGTRLLRGATEAVDDGMNAGAAFSKINLSTAKYRLDFEFSTEALEDGREGTDLEDHIVRLMASQAAQDVEDYAVNGDNSKTTDPGIGVQDGWDVIAKAKGHVIDAGGQTLSRELLGKMVKELPRAEKNNRSALRFYASSNAAQDYLDSEITYREGVNQPTDTNGANVVYGDSVTRAYGVSLKEVPMFSDDQAWSAGSSTAPAGLGISSVWLTNPQNLVFASQRQIQLYHEFVPKKDAIEYTCFIRFGLAIEEGNSIVVAKNVGVK